jgi:hypothetical protein
MSKPKTQPAVPNNLTIADSFGTRPVSVDAASGGHAKATPTKVEPVARLASGRLAKWKKGDVMSAARLNAIIEDLEAAQKRIAQLEKAITPKAAPAKGKAK